MNLSWVLVICIASVILSRKNAKVLANDKSAGEIQLDHNENGSKYAHSIVFSIITVLMPAMLV